MTWAPDGRATFEYGTPEGHGAHVTWRRIGRVLAEELDGSEVSAPEP